MASNSSTTSKNGYSLIIEAVENSYSVPDNSSNVTITLSLKANGTRFLSYWCSGEITIDGTAAASYAAYYDLSSQTASVVLASYTGTVYHDPDGSRAVSAAGSLSCASGDYSAGSGSVSVSLPLTDIPRASVLTSLSGHSAAEDYLTAGITKYAPSFYHKLTLSASGTAVKTVYGYNSGEAITLTDPELMTLYRLAGTSKTAAFSASLATYTDSGMGTCVGSSSISADISTRGNVRMNSGGTWTCGKLFRNVSGVWKPCLVLRKSSGTWGRGK